jgi:hypothetical protein
MPISEPPWKSRQEFPDGVIRHTADQYECASRLLWEEAVSGSPVLFPFLNCAAIALELYLKSLDAKLIFTPDEHIPGMSVVTVKSQWGHALVPLFDKIAEEDRTQLEDAFVTKHPEANSSFREMVGRFEGLFQQSRYSYEKGADITKYHLDPLRATLVFLRDYIATLQEEDRIVWRR